jgi:hypothetical protein
VVWQRAWVEQPQHPAEDLTIYMPGPVQLLQTSHK